MSKSLIVLVFAGMCGLAFGSDHRDGPAATVNPAADLTDLYSWTSADGTKVNLAISVFPSATATAKFDTAVKYVITTRSQSVFGTPPVTPHPVRVICTFDAAQNISCWVTDSSNAVLDYVVGDASNSGGIPSVNGKFRVFAGLRDDPFFWYQGGWKNAVTIVRGALGAFTKDAAGCLGIDTPTAQQIIASLSGSTNGRIRCTDPVLV